MNIFFDAVVICVRQIVVDDMFDAVDVQSTS